MDGDGPAIGGKGEGDGAADALAGAGDERGARQRGGRRHRRPPPLLRARILLSVTSRAEVPARPAVERPGVGAAAAAWPPPAGAGKLTPRSACSSRRISSRSRAASS